MRDLLKVAFIIVFCSIAACSEQKTERYRQLEVVDMLSRQNENDSAKYLLDSIGALQLTEGESALYNLLSIRLYGTQHYYQKLDTILDYNERIFKSTNDTSHLAEVYIYKADNYFLFKKQYDSCEYYLELGKKLVADNNIDNFLLSKAYWYQIFLDMVLGNTEQIKNDAEMQTYYAEKSKNERQIAYAALNTVIVLKYIGETDKLDLPLQAALNWSKYLKPQDVSFIYNVYGELAIEKNPVTAKENFDKALAIQPDSKLTKANLARLFLQQGDIKQAENLCTECADRALAEDRINILTILIDCKMAKNNLPEVINLQKQIIAEKDSMIKRIQDQKKHYSFSITKEEAKSDNNLLLLVISISLGILLIIAFVIVYNLSKKQNKSKELINELEKNLSAINKELAIEKELNKRIKNPGKELYNKIMADENCSQWNKPEMVCFLEYYNILHPKVLEKIESEYDNISTRDKIILLLIEIGKPKETILETFGLTESAYQTTMSRIKTKNAVLV